ncbi:right-handed parallel beta-helix repeat-containing protein [Chloroflexota bacterium]
MVKLRTSIHLALVLILLLSFTSIAPTNILANQNDNGGSFDIFILENGGWQSQGQLSFADYETLQLPLGNYTGQVTLRLVQQGHDAAFIDYVALQKDDMSYSPMSAINLDSSTDVLTKVLWPEYDVCEAWDSTIEIVWDNIPENATLTMRAMEEDLGEGHGTPLFYPVIHIGQTLSYTLINDGGITVDGMLEESIEPDFSVFWEPDSPHPDGYTYGWLHSDDGYLYAAFDVTADNTPDEEDWGALYVMVNGEPKEFRVSSSDLTWGIYGFQYTSCVPYEHRVYEFAIPLTEINGFAGDEVQYAFGCYGTVAVMNEVYVDDDCSGTGDGSPGDPFCTIQQGYGAVIEGGTIYVAPGNYEGIHIMKPVSIIGAGCGQSYVTATGPEYVFGVFINSTTTIYDVTISGFDIYGGNPDGIALGWAENCSILDNCIHNNPNGVSLHESDSNLIKDNNIYYNGCGIYLDDSSDNEIYCNDIHNNNPTNASGIHLIGTSANNSINYNNINANGFGVYNDTSNEVDATNNWWGCSDGPGNLGCDNVFGNVDYTPVLTEECEVCPLDVQPTHTVGGTVYPVDKLNILLPWILGGIGLVVVLALLWSRYRRVRI